MIRSVPLTNSCIKEVDALQQESERFNDLSVEQLLYSAIVGTNYDDVLHILENIDWYKWCPNED